VRGFSGPVPQEMWTALRDEFSCHPWIRSAPASSSDPGGQLDPHVIALFEAALEAKESNVDPKL
jgi:hypothetical protein